MRTARVVAVVAILACTVACAVGSSVVDLAPPNHGPALGWARHAKADPAHPVLVTVAVKQRCSAARLEAELMAVSSPDSPRYGKYLSLEEVTELVASPQASLDAVVTWLKSAGAKDLAIARTRDFVTAHVAVADIESVLMPGTSMHVWHKPTSSGNMREVVRSNSGKALLPAHVFDVVDAVEGVYDFPGSRRTSTARARASKPDRLTARDPRAAPVVDSAAGLFSPYISMALGIDSGAVVMVSPYCTNGSLPTSTLSCPVAITSVDVTLAEVNTSNTWTLSVDFNATTCPCTSQGCVCTLGTGSLVNYVQYSVSAVTNYANSSSPAAEFTPPVIPSAFVTPQAIRKFYNIPAAVNGDSAPSNSQAVIEFQGQFYSVSDLAKFSKLNNLVTPDVVVVGSNNSSQPGVEATLDIQMVTAVGTQAKTYFWYSKGYILQYLAEISSDKNPPLVQSISYGTPELFSVQANIIRANTEFMKAGLRGLTIISTAGDLGVSDGVLCASEFYADFPSSSPYTTSLGATSVSRFSTDTSPVCAGTYTAFGVDILCAPFTEVPCALNTGAGFTTGGMFSTMFGRPNYQDEAVQNYLNTANPPTSMFNTTGRGYNDVAAFGNNILVVQNGDFEVSGGTSASGPIFAGVVGLLNDQLLSAGKPSLGFMNPFLYSAAAKQASDNFQMFNVVHGGNNRCGETMCCNSGLPGTTDGSWSPLGGLGSPNFSGLLDAAMGALPDRS